VDLRIVPLDEEGSVWDRALALMPANRRDVYFESAYALVWQLHGDGRAMGAIWNEPHGRVLYPFLLRELATLPGLGAEATGLHDISTAYGYGGPLVDAGTDDAGVLSRFRAAFDAWCAAHGVVSEFVRFHPLIETQRGLERHLEVVPLGETVWCPVGEADGDLIEGMDSGHRRNLRKAQKAGLVARLETGDDAYDRFRELYTATMARRGAVEGYFFDATYFRSFRELLGEQQALIGVRHGDEMIAGGLLMRSERFAHYHLGGSSAAHLHLRPNNLFFYEAMEWARRQGVSALHLGGGYRPDDELLRFKRGLGSGRATFAIGRKIHLREHYERLTALHYGRVGTVSSGFFPAYRAPTAVGDGS
jgi:serine/alanine adding enzyme